MEKFYDLGQVKKDLVTLDCPNEIIEDFNENQMKKFIIDNATKITKRSSKWYKVYRLIDWADAWDFINTTMSKADVNLLPWKA